MIVEIYSRPGCHLCDQARGRIFEMREEGRGFEVREIDIESSDDLLRRYLERIPVVKVEGEVVSELVLDEVALQARLDTVSA